MLHTGQKNFDIKSNFKKERKKEMATSLRTQGIMALHCFLINSVLQSTEPLKTLKNWYTIFYLDFCTTWQCKSNSCSKINFWETMTVTLHMSSVILIVFKDWLISVLKCVVGYNYIFHWGWLFLWFTKFSYLTGLSYWHIWQKCSVVVYEEKMYLTSRFLVN